MASVITGNISAYLAAEYLVRVVGQEAVQAAIIRGLVWEEDIEGLDTMAAHFRTVSPIALAPAATEGTTLPQATWTPNEVLVSCGLDGFYIEVSKTSSGISPKLLGQIAYQSGTSLARTIDNSLAALFPSFTAGTVGTSGGALTVANIFSAEADLFAAHAEVGGPFYGVLAPQQYGDLKNNMLTLNYGVARVNVDGTGKGAAAPLEVGSVTIYQSTLVPENTSATNYTGGIFSRQALGVAVAKQPLVEIQSVPKEASWAIEATTTYGVGVIRPTFGVLVQSGINA